MKKSNKLVALILAVMLVLSSVSVMCTSAASSGGFQYEVIGGEAIITGYTGDGSSISIPQTLGGYPVTRIAREVFINTSYYKDNNNWSGANKDVLYIGDVLVDAKYTAKGSLAIKEGTRIIADYALYMCGAITDVTIPASVQYIGENCFLSCSKLDTVSISSGNKYFLCENGVIYNKAKTELVCALNSKSDSNYSIPSTVTTIRNNAFNGCSEIYEITIPESVKTIGEYAFAYCEKLISVKLPSAITEVPEGCFDHCSNLSSVVLSSNTKSIGDYAFRWCAGMNAFNMPSKVSKIGNSTFYECRGLKSVSVPASVKSIDDGAFYDCQKLTNIYFGGTSSQWNGVSVALNNNPLKSAKVSYNWSDVSSVGGYVTGDVDQDTFVNIKDATEVQKSIANISEIGCFREILGDCDEDGRLTIKDATAIQKVVAKIN